MGRKQGAYRIFRRRERQISNIQFSHWELLTKGKGYGRKGLPPGSKSLRGWRSLARKHAGIARRQGRTSRKVTNQVGAYSKCLCCARVSAVAPRRRVRVLPCKRSGSGYGTGVNVRSW